MFRKRIESFGHAWRGVEDLVRTQPNARIHIFFAALALGLGLVLGCTPAEWALLLLTIGWVISLEALNTALEYLTDLASPQYHPLAGKAKDLAAAAVMVGAFLAVLVGLALFGPKLFQLVFTPP